MQRDAEVSSQRGKVQEPGRQMLEGEAEVRNQIGRVRR